MQNQLLMHVHCEEECGILLYGEGKVRVCTAYSVQYHDVAARDRYNIYTVVIAQE